MERRSGHCCRYEECRTSEAPVQEGSSSASKRERSLGSQDESSYKKLHLRRVRIVMQNAKKVQSHALIQCSVNKISHGTSGSHSADNIPVTFGIKTFLV